MCGIIGCSWPDHDFIKKGLKVLDHRGPDQQGVLVDDRVSLGHKRLSIIDLSQKAKQPFLNSNEDLALVYNGEVYNFLELRAQLEQKGYRFVSDSDTEVVLYAYEEWGDACVERLNGFFAFCIYDKKKKRLFLARDRLGIKPLYYTFHNNNLVFASEIKAILELKDLKRVVNKSVMGYYLTLGYPTSNQTMFEGIKRLPQAHTMSYDLTSKKTDIKKFWSIPKQTKVDEAFAAHKVEELLSDSVKKRLVADRPVGIFLSGGIDSTSVAALARQHIGDAELQTYSVGFNHAEDELSYAQHVANELSTNHREFTLTKDIVNMLPSVVWHSDEPIADSALIPIKFLSEQAKKTSTVILTGDGADEIFGGYEQYKFLNFFHKFHKVPKTLRSWGGKTIQATPYQILNRFFKYSKAIGQQGKKRVATIVSEIEDRQRAYLEFVALFNEEEKNDILKSPNQFSPTNFSSHFESNESYINQLLHLETKTLLADQFLMKNDKMAMAHSLEVRVPFLDHRLVELAFSLPDALKVKGFQEKYILKKAMKKHLPLQTTKRAKQRFYVPMDEWIQKDLANFFEQLPKQGSGHFQYDHIAKIFKNYTQSPLFYGRQLWSVLSFELWHKQYIEQASVGELL